jgi:hypothetical protein
VPFFSQNNLVRLSRGPLELMFESTIGFARTKTFWKEESKTSESRGNARPKLDRLAAETPFAAYANGLAWVGTGQFRNAVLF